LGYPKKLRTDNGGQYVSVEFKKYCETNGIDLITTPPYWPQANGEVENMNRSLVKLLKIAHVNDKNYRHEIQKFILMYNVTPHGTTGSPPSELMFNRTIRDKIPGVQDIVGEVGESEERDRDFINKEKGKEVADKTRRATESKIQLGDKLVLKNVTFPSKLTPNFDTTVYEVIQIDGSVVKISGGGKTYLRNISHVKKMSGVLVWASNLLNSWMAASKEMVPHLEYCHHRYRKPNQFPSRLQMRSRT